MKNNRILQALLCQPVDQVPVWMMRQAGRYLPEFRALRAAVPDFMTFCKTPELACEATLQPLARFDLDAAIIFSDILTVVDALGFQLCFEKGTGPVVKNPVTCLSDLKNLSAQAALQKLDYVFEAVRITARALADKVPLIGFAGSPWTVACYMIQGRNENHFHQARRLVYEQPQIVHALLRVLTELTVLYVNEQIAAGAEIIMLFDSWGGLLSASHYPEFSLNYLQEIGQRMHRTWLGKTIPLIFFTKYGGSWLPLIAASGCDAIGLDWTVDLARARLQVGPNIALQGNLDPLALFGTPDSVREAVRCLLQDVSVGHVFNLGHGIDKDTPLENVYAMMAAVREFSC